MDYKLLKMTFPAGIHIGSGMLTDGEPIFTADTFFSALCLEAIRMPGGIDKIYQLCSEGKILFSDALPYIGQTLYIPKPYIEIKGEHDGDSVKKKAFKKLNYIPMDKLDVYLQGKIDAVSEVEKYRGLGKYEMRAQVVVNRNKDPEPYHVGIYHYNENAGLYIIVGYSSPSDWKYFYELIYSLSYTGIGGKKSSGLGKFQIEERECPKEFCKHLSGDYKKYISLSISLPQIEEMNVACADSNYKLVKRGGFVYSETYAPEAQKKKTVYLFSAGSCFINKYKGCILDVSVDGAHPVYKYAKPLFVGV